MVLIIGLADVFHSTFLSAGLPVIALWRGVFEPLIVPYTQIDSGLISAYKNDRRSMLRAAQTQ